MHDLRQQLIADHLHLPGVIATRCSAEFDLAGLIPFDDLVAYGNKGLLEAASRYSLDTGTKFSTFSWHRIRGAMIDGVRASGPYNRPQVTARRELETAADSPSADVLVDALLTQSDVEIDDLAGDDQCSPEAAIDARRLRAAVVAAVEALSARQRQVVRLHYFEGHRFTEIGQILDLTREYVSRLHAQALGQLKAALAHTGELVSQ